MNAASPTPRPTIRDVAERAAVSKSLVSLVLRDSPNVSDTKRQAVIDAIKELGYRPNAAARNLGSQRTHAIGVLISDIRNPWFVDLLDGISSALHGEGYHVLLGDGRLNARTDESLTRTFIEMRVDGLVLAGTMTIPPSIREAAGQIPIVAAGTRDITLDGVDTVANDDVAGAELATRHLIELGHERIAHIAGFGAVGAFRQQSYEQTMTATGRGAMIDVIPSDMTEEGGYRAAMKALTRADRPTAIFAFNDMVCIGAYSAAMELGLKVPDDLSLVGYDNTHLVRMRHLLLSSVDNASHEVGRIAARTLLARLDHRTKPTTTELVAPWLETRGSTSQPPTDVTQPAR